MYYYIQMSVVDPESDDLDHVNLVDSDEKVSFMELVYGSEDNQIVYYIVENSYLKMIPVVEDDDTRTRTRGCRTK